jgi:maltose phosphorylase
MQTSVKTDLPHVGDAVEAKQVANHFAGHVAAGQSVTLEKRTIVTTSRDYADQAELVAAAQDLVSQVDQVSYDDLLAAHVSQWAQRWAKSDVVIEGDDEAQQGIRFNLFQLFSTYYGNDSRLKHLAKGLHRRKVRRGHLLGHRGVLPAGLPWGGRPASRQEPLVLPLPPATGRLR